MKAPSPAFSLYPKDVFSDEHCQAMKHSEFGMYVRLLCHCWIEGSIPADPVRLQRLLKITHKTFSASWPAIAPCFVQREDRLVQLRLEEERAKQISRSLQNSERGRKGGRPLESTKVESRNLAAGSPQESLPSPSSVSLSPRAGETVVEAIIRLDGSPIDEIPCPGCGKVGFLRQNQARGTNPPGFWCHRAGGCGANWPIDCPDIIGKMTARGANAVRALGKPPAKERVIYASEALRKAREM